MKLFELDLGSVGDTRYGQDYETTNALMDAAPNDMTIYKDCSNLRIVGDELQVRSIAGSHNHNAFYVMNDFDLISPVSWLTYQVKFDDPFDFGGNRKAWARGGKLPGMMRGDVGSNTGGNHTTKGWSGRLMWRGLGTPSQPPTGTAFSAYLYYDEKAGLPHGKYGSTDLWRDDIIGDVVPIRDGWNTLVLGYAVDGDQGWFNAFEEVGGVLVDRCYVNQIRWMEEINQGSDRFLWQTYWGGGGDEWLPDRPSQMRFRRMAAFTTFDEAAVFALTQPQPKCPPFDQDAFDQWAEDSPTDSIRDILDRMDSE